MWDPFKEKTSYGTSNISSGSLGCLHTSLYLFARTRENWQHEYNHHRSSSFPGAQWKDLHAYYFVWIAVSHLLWSFIRTTLIEAWQRYLKKILGGALKQKYTERGKTWVVQRALPNSSFPPIHLSIWIFQVLRLRTRRTYYRSPTSFSFFSSSLNHSLSMHSVHFLPNLELERSRIVEVWGALIATLHGGTYIHIFPVLDWDPKQ